MGIVAGMAADDLILSNLLYRPANWLTPFLLEDVFPRTAPVEVEIGSGDGSFLVSWAATHPERNFLGVERLLGRLRKMERKARRAGLTNLRSMRIEAGYLVKFLLPPRSVSALHIYFPDPWPKRKHRGNRLVNEKFVESVARIMGPAGMVYLRTDDGDYAGQMKSVFASQAHFEPSETTTELISATTDFEREFHARDIATRHLAYRLRLAAAAAATHQ